MIFCHAQMSRIVTFFFLVRNGTNIPGKRYHLGAKSRWHKYLAGNAPPRAAAPSFIRRGRSPKVNPYYKYQLWYSTAGDAWTWDWLVPGTFIVLHTLRTTPSSCALISSSILLMSRFFLRRSTHCELLRQCLCSRIGRIGKVDFRSTIY